MPLITDEWPGSGQSAQSPPTGYLCRCGAWVSSGQSHSCLQPSTQTPPIPWRVNKPKVVLERLSDVDIERIVAGVIAGLGHENGTCEVLGSTCPYRRVFLESPEVMVAEVRRLRDIEAAVRGSGHVRTHALSVALAKSYRDYL